MRALLLLSLLGCAACGEAWAQSLGGDGIQPGAIGPGGMGDGFPRSGTPTTGIDSMPIALTINGTTVTAPMVDYRGKNASASGWTCSAASAGAACPTMTKDGSTAAMTYGASAGTGTASDTAVVYAGAGANTDEHFDGDASTGDLTTEDFVAEFLVRVDSVAALGFMGSKTSATAGYRTFYGAADQYDVGLKTASTQSDITAIAGVPRVGKFEFCTLCQDRSSATGTVMMCNGQFLIYQKDLSARTASLTNATVFSLGGDHETASRRVFNGRIGLWRMWKSASWFSNATTECTTVHRARLRSIVKAEKRYLFIGDSITGRIVAGAPSPVVSWPRLYSDSASQLVAAVNAGDAGKRCDEMQSGEWTTERDNGYARLYLECGVNDVAAGASAATIESRITTLITEAHARGMQVIVTTITPWKAAAAWTAGFQTVTDSVNTWILANSAGADFVVDTYSALENTPGDDLLKAAYDSGDGIHPNGTGLQAMADAVALVVAP